MEFNRNLGWIRGGSDVDPGWSDTHFRNDQFPTGFIPWYLYFCSAIILLRYTFAPQNSATLFSCYAETLQQSSTALIARPNYKAAMNVIEKEMMTHRKPYKPLVKWRIPEIIISTALLALNFLQRENSATQNFDYTIFFATLKLCTNWKHTKTAAVQNDNSTDYR